MNFSLNFKFSLNFIMNASYHLGIAAIFVLGGYYVVTGRTVNDEQQAYVDSPDTAEIVNGEAAAGA